MLTRRLRTADAVVVGLGSMIGAGVFVVFAPAAAAAGSALLLSLAIAGIIAFCNATSSARLATRYPVSGGSYVYGRERLGDFWGYLAGWSFVVGKTASCAAMALTVGLYLWPAHAHAVAVIAVAALTAVNYRGIQKSARVTWVLVAVVLAILAVVVGVVAGSPQQRISLSGSSVSGVLEAAGLLFFAFAGYARIATLGEEVLDPARTIARAIRLALLITLTVYAAVALSLLSALGPSGLASATAPLAQAVEICGAPGFAPVVRAAAVVAALGSLLSLILGVSRTCLAMARDGYLPAALSAVHPRYGVPHRAEMAVGVIVAGVAALADIRGAIGFSSFAVLAYYAVANASAWTLEGPRRHRVIPAVGLIGCVLLACYLPASSVIAGGALLAAGAVAFAVTRPL